MTSRSLIIALALGAACAAPSFDQAQVDKATFEAIDSDVRVLHG